MLAPSFCVAAQRDTMRAGVMIFLDLSGGFVARSPP